MLNDAEKIIHAAASQEGFSVSGFSSLSGGSINDVYLIHTPEKKMVMKVNLASRYPGMFEAERAGLEALKASQTMDVPEVNYCGKSGDSAYLIMEYKTPASETAEFRENFAVDLAALHRTTASFFGFHSSNYIGSLPQQNEKRDSAAAFYIDQRLKPQIRMAADNGFTFSDTDQVFKNISTEIPEEPPSLIHGDLWSGNYLVTAHDTPCLIDPAVSYAPREMDLAMMKLFGGFSPEIFSRYEEIFPLQPGFKERIPLWQLYYLLVHLNIFGSSYLTPVKKIMTRYS